MLTPGETIATHTLDGQSVVIRAPRLADARAMMNYINTLSRERTYILRQGEQLTLAEEKTFVQGQLKKFERGVAVTLLAFINDELVGIADVDLGSFIEPHVGNLGISLAKSARGKGLGKIFMRTLLQTARKHIRGLRIVKLAHFGNNLVARKMYEAFGFREYGRLPGGVRHRGKYVDHVWMSLDREGLKKI